MVAPEHGREGAEPPVLLPHGRRHRHVAQQLDADGLQRVERRQVGDEPALHVAGAPAVEPVADHLAPERVVDPGFRLPGRYRVDVGVEEQRPASSPSAAYPGDVRAVLVGLLAADVVAVGIGLFCRRLPHVHLQAAPAEGVLHLLLDGPLLARRRGDAHQLLQEPHGVVAAGLHLAGHGVHELPVKVRHQASPKNNADG